MGDVLMKPVIRNLGQKPAHDLNRGDWFIFNDDDTYQVAQLAGWKDASEYFDLRSARVTINGAEVEREFWSHENVTKVDVVLELA
ncbi:hypothetical protein JRC04_05095 [Mycolicibacterium sp. S2-37]|uniref:hypothetical protein n=1 Tax=Mycolicibacterium sp. S2-37 TaxID=2810297 RepID=UPI001A942EF0|nr:hypothetical protein [Mycolicibacterium sp. S2-37]MBO0676834.1 hypothetical protein [Mycolicibacterium sp. S2-37]